MRETKNSKPVPALQELEERLPTGAEDAPTNKHFTSTSVQVPNAEPGGLDSQEESLSKRAPWEGLGDTFWIVPLVPSSPEISPSLPASTQSQPKLCSDKVSLPL